MAVIINDFEIMVEAPEQRGGTQPMSASTPSPQANQPAQAAGLQPQDIERIMRHFEERRCRLIAN
jgi:hypothetical protein